jgi:hypothetical protein
VPILCRSLLGWLIVDALMLEITNDLVWILDGSNRPQFAGAVDTLSDIDLKDFGQHF